MSNESKEYGLAGGGDFRHLFCQHYGCPLEQFEEKLFRKCLLPRAVRIAPVLRRVEPSVFKPDFELIKHTATAANLGELEREVDVFRRYFPPMGFWRRLLNVRMSGRLLLNVGQELFH